MAEQQCTIEQSAQKTSEVFKAISQSENVNSESVQTKTDNSKDATPRTFEGEGTTDEEDTTTDEEDTATDEEDGSKKKVFAAPLAFRPRGRMFQAQTTQPSNEYMVDVPESWGMSPDGAMMGMFSKLELSEK